MKKNKKDINYELYYQSALDLGFPCTRLNHIAGFKVEIGSTNYYFRSGETPFNNGSSTSLARNKYCVNKLLAHAGIPVPKAIGITREEYQNGDYSLSHLRFPVVGKPTIDSSLGTDVVCNIQTEEILQTYLKKNFEKYSCLSIEEFHANLRSYRILVFYNKIIGVTERLPARVIGDGIHSISELITLSNKLREEISAKVSLGPIKVDDEYFIRLEEIGKSLDSIPEKNETVQLCYACNSSRGGTMISLGTTICRENARLAIKAARALNLNLVGFDVVCEDINIPFTQSKGVFIEANHNPDISIHEAPISGIKNRVTRKIMQRLAYQHPFSYLIIFYKKLIKSYYFRIATVIVLIIIFQHFVSNTIK